MDDSTFNNIIKNPSLEDLSKGNECLDCDYIGRDGYWIGTVHFNDGTKKPIEGHVDEGEDGHFDLDELLKNNNINNEDVLQIEGEANCPSCKSTAYYMM